MPNPSEWNLPPGEVSTPIEVGTHRLWWFAWKAELATWPVAIPHTEDG